MDSCKVCGSLTASKHNHYGSDLICHSCRGFFMRSVKNSMFEKFKHNTLDGQCVIDSKTRQSCKKCRYEKCLQAGMRNAFVQKQAGIYEQSRVENFTSTQKYPKFLSSTYTYLTQIPITQPTDKGWK